MGVGTLPVYSLDYQEKNPETVPLSRLNYCYKLCIAWGKGLKIKLKKNYFRTSSGYLVKLAYSNHYRRMVPKILDILEFRSNNDVHRPVIEAIELIKKYAFCSQRYYDSSEEVPLEGILRNSWREIIMEKDSDGNERINRINYELSVLQALREQLRCKEIWVVGANRYRNPEEDLPIT